MWPTIRINRAELVAAIKASVGKMSYRLGAKPKLGAVPGQTGARQTDCSGYVRWLLHRLGHAAPDGSWHQWAWCKLSGFKLTDYKHAALLDDRLRIAFIASSGSTPGHVWLIINGQTIEAAGGRGACRRPWDTPTLRSKVCACYVLTHPLNQ